MPPSTMKDVPQDDVGTVVQSFIDNDDKAKITCKRQQDGKWEIVAED